MIIFDCRHRSSHASRRRHVVCSTEQKYWILRTYPGDRTTCSYVSESQTIIMDSGIPTYRMSGTLDDQRFPWNDNSNIMGRQTEIGSAARLKCEFFEGATERKTKSCIVSPIIWHMRPLLLDACIDSVHTHHWSWTGPEIPHPPFTPPPGLGEVRGKPCVR